MNPCVVPSNDTFKKVFIIICHFKNFPTNLNSVLFAPKSTVSQLTLHPLGTSAVVQLEFLNMGQMRCCIPLPFHRWLVDNLIAWKWITLATWSSAGKVDGHPERGLSSDNVQPSLKHLYYSWLCDWLGHSSPKASCNIWKGSVNFLPNFTQNLKQKHYSSFWYSWQKITKTPNTANLFHKNVCYLTTKKFTENLQQLSTGRDTTSNAANCTVLRCSVDVQLNMSCM